MKYNSFGSLLCIVQLLERRRKFVALRGDFLESGYISLFLFPVYLFL
jgi:hypothetical protein